MGLSEIIDSTWLGNFIRRKADIVLSTDPDKIYVENIRSFFGVNTRIAKAMCEFAVRSGHFSKHVGYICPNSNCRKIIIEVLYNKNINQDNIECLNCLLREERVNSWKLSEIEVIEFYRLKKGDTYAS